MKKREGATRDNGTVTVGDFIFEGYVMKEYLWGVLNSWKKDKKEYEKKVLDLMAKHYEFYKQFQEENKYVKKGSILYCDKGTHLTRFDIIKDHAVVDSSGTPIGICNDCKANDNIYSFGICRNTSPDKSHKRASVTLQDGTEVCTGEKCIPMLLNDQWGKTAQEKDLKIWDDEEEEFCDAITTGDYLVCYYGGLIKVAEVPEVEEPKGIISAEMMQDFGWDISKSELETLNNTLEDCEITDACSVRLFMATCAHESAKGERALEMLNKDGTTAGKYEPYERGAGYIQLTREGTQRKFLESVSDEFTETEIAEYIAEKYPWQAAAWFWSSRDAITISKNPKMTLNEYAKKYGDSIGVYLLTQYVVNGSEGSPANDILREIRDGKKTFSVVNGKVFVDGADVGRAPNGWNNAENIYNREATYYEAIKSFP